MEELKMLTQEEVAKLLHTHVTTIITLREVGILIPIKAGRNFMFTQKEVKNFQRVYRGLDVSKTFNEVFIEYMKVEGKCILVQQSNIIGLLLKSMFQIV